MIVRCLCWFISRVSFPVIFLQNSPFCCTDINHLCHNASIENGAVRYTHNETVVLSTNAIKYTLCSGRFLEKQE